MYSLDILSVCLFFFIIWIYCAPSKALEFEYHDEKKLESVLRNFTKSTKSIKTEMYSIGNSTYKKIPLWVVELSGAHKSKFGIPNIKFVANIHGNEAVGREMLLHFMEYLRDEYKTNDLVKCLLDNSNIHLLPCMNPDGFAVAIPGLCEGELGRDNGRKGNLEDLNRNFPDLFHNNGHEIERETKALMDWMTKKPFTLSAGLHGGAMVANYPFDTMKTEKTSDEHLPSKSPDDDVFRNLASVYATNHPKMKKSLCEDDQRRKPSFKDGITNGAAWYSFQGGMQDYNYFKHGCMEITLEISCCKYPRASELSELWEQNKKALLMYSLEALKGVAGQVFDSVSRTPIANATLKIVGRNMTFRSSDNGEFWRILLPGAYRIEVGAPGYYTETKNFIVNTTKNQCPQPTRLQILLTNSSLPTTPRSISIHDTHISTEKNNRFGRSRPTDNEVNNISSVSSAINGNVLLSRIEDQLNVLQLSQTRAPGPVTGEGIFFLRDLFQNPELDVSKLTKQDIIEFLKTDLSISDVDIKQHFDSVLADFEGKVISERVAVFVKIFDIIIDKPVADTDTAWLKSYVYDIYVTDGLRSDNKYFSMYNRSSVIEKMDIILMFNDLLEQKNTSNLSAVSSPLMCSVFLLLFIWK